MKEQAGHVKINHHNADCLVGLRFVRTNGQAVPVQR